MALVAALASDAELLLLDEPTSGLDPLMEAVFQDTVREITGEGRTVLLSSHILAEVEALCDRVSIIRAGRTVESGTLADLRHLTRTSITVETDRPVDRARPTCPACTTRGSRAPAPGSTSTPRSSTACCAAWRTLGVRSLTSQPPTLEELFLRHYGDELARASKDATTGPRGDGGAARDRAAVDGPHPGAEAPRSRAPWTLVRLVLRRGPGAPDPSGSSPSPLVSWSSAASVKGLYPTQADLDAAAAPLYDNAAVIAFNGPTVRHRHARRADRLPDRRFGYVVVALMSMFLVGRHTRADEEERPHRAAAGHGRRPQRRR